MLTHYGVEQCVVIHFALDERHGGHVERIVMFVNKNIGRAIELHIYQNNSFCFIEWIGLLVTWVKATYRLIKSTGGFLASNLIVVSYEK